MSCSKVNHVSHSPKPIHTVIVENIGKQYICHSHALNLIYHLDYVAHMENLTMNTVHEQKQTNKELFKWGDCNYGNTVPTV